MFLVFINLKAIETFMQTLESSLKRESKAKASFAIINTLKKVLLFLNFLN